jgi:Tfp pilus assembly protein PilF
MITKTNTWKMAATALAASVLLCGCQTVSSWMPQHDKVAEARQNESAKDTGLTENITPAQKLNVQLAVAQSVEEENHPDQAAKIYLDVIKKDSHSVAAYQRLGLLYAKQGQWALSQKYFEGAINLAPKSPELQCDLGYAFYLQRRDKEAEVCFHHALALDANYGRAHNDLGLVMARAANENEALKEFGRAGCTESQAHANLALCYSIENRLNDARLHYRIALAMDPNLAIARSGMAALDKVDEKLIRDNHVEQPQLTSRPQIGAF